MEKVPWKRAMARAMTTITLLFLFCVPALASAASVEGTDPADVESQVPPARFQIVLGSLRLHLPESYLEAIAHRDDMVVVKCSNGNTLTHRILSKDESKLYKDAPNEAKRATKLISPEGLSPEIHVRKLGDASLYLRATKNTAGYRTMLFIDGQKAHYIDLLMSKTEALKIFQTAMINPTPS